MSVAAGGDAAEPAKMENKGTVVIYSPYLNKHKSIQEGRRIPQAAAVEDPTAWEILEVCKRIFPEGCVEGENKGYSRDYEAQWPPMRGRIRVKIKDAEGKYTHAEIHTRRQLFMKVAELIPKMASRQPGYYEQHVQQQERVKGGNKKKKRK
mmetsp:Transcript_36614/g.71462  ORF Transcript_36614/g.71462 Transcript_36614/m.71462 type:complete len:151 (+) Transcript_36614:31-483(+)